MNTEQRIKLLVRLGSYMSENEETWQAVKDRAYQENGWFVPEYIDIAIHNIVQAFLQKEKLEAWAAQYHLPLEIQLLKQSEL